MNETQAILELNDVRRTYTMGSETVHALAGIDLKIFKGEFVSIVGSSGSGKSTLLHILGLLDLPSSGSMSLGDRRIDGIEDDELSRIRNATVGVVFQQFNLLADLTVLENIALPLAYQGIERDERQKMAKAEAERVGLGSRLHHKPKELSGGQAQRVAIARALVVNPDVIMADEPTGALDSKTSKEIMDLFTMLHQEGKTIIMVTHDPELAELGSRKITISDGKITEDKPLSNPPLTSFKPDTHTSRQQLMFSDLLRIGIREGLLAHKLRTALTMLGIVIGVASVISMSSFSEGSKKKQEEQIKALGVNLIKIIDKQLEGESLHQARVKGSLGLRRSDARALKERVSGLKYISMVRKIRMNVLYQKAQLPDDIDMIGIEGDYANVNNLTLQEGRWFTAEDHVKLRRVIIIGDGLASRMKRDGVPKILREQLVLGGQVYTIIGVLSPKHIDTKELDIQQIGDSNQSILLPLPVIQFRTRHHRLRSELDEIQVQIENEDQLFEAGKHIHNLISSRHKRVEDFNLFIPLDILKAKQQSQKLLDVLSLSICAISLLVGGIGIMNIMLASVSERMKEIGIRRAIGAKKRDIRRQFLTESILISLAGSIVGLGIAAISVVSLCQFLELPIVFSPPLLFMAVALAIVTGVAFGFFPAKHAAENNVIEVLRNE